MLAHIQKRKATPVAFEPDGAAGGLIVETSYARPETLERARHMIRERHLPVLRLASITSASAETWSEFDDVPDKLYWSVRYSRLHIGLVAIDVFLQASCGYRVQLEGDEDRLNQPEASDSLFPL